MARLLVPALFVLTACSSESAVNSPPIEDSRIVEESETTIVDTATTVPSGGGCSTAADCIDTTTDVCDPKSGACVPGQCGPTSGKSCSATEICVYQARGTGVGACYPICRPFGDSCGADAECLISRFDGTTGYCKKRGPGAPDSV